MASFSQLPLSTHSKGLLLPKSPMDPLYGRVKKVFIAYVHNPTEYEVYIPPYTPEQLLASPNLLQRVIKEKTEHEKQQMARISHHTNTIHRLAKYLASMGVAVAYEEYWTGHHATNRLRLLEDQIEDSDYVLLVVTPSMNHYLRNTAPVDDEILFTDNLLYNLMTIKRPSGTHFVPVFINSPKETGLLPTCLAAATCYTLTEPFDCEVSGDLNDLYRMFTNQIRKDDTPTINKVVKVPKKKPAFSFMSTCSSTTPLNPELYSRLSHDHSLIPDHRFLDLAYQLARDWKRIAIGLRLTEREIAECQVKGQADPQEACYQMLSLWKEKDPNNATIACLAGGMKSGNCGGLLKHLVVSN